MNKPKLTRDQFKERLPLYQDFAYAVYLRNRVLHHIKYGNARLAGDAARRMVHIFLPFLNWRERAGLPPREEMLVKIDERMRELLADMHSDEEGE